jgi:hypothetical protein
MYLLPILSPGSHGNDILNGGNDTAVYFGTRGDYDINRISAGIWKVSNVRGAKDAGTDTLTNIENIQFDNGNFFFPGRETFKLANNGLTFQKDIAFVINTTGSMRSEIVNLKTQISSLADALSIGGKILGLG